MPDAPLRIAVIGCGAVARRYYAPALRALECEGVLHVRALCDPDVRGTAELCAIFPAATVAQDAAAIAAPAIDLAIVASPPRCHAEQTIAALRAGVAVLCEKPMATTVADGEAMVSAARDTGRVLAVGFYRRFLPAAQAIGELLRSGRLGALRRFHCAEGGDFRWPARSPDFFRRGAGGGVLADVGVHTLDLLGWWLGEPEHVDYEDDAMGGVEANCRIHLTYPDGVIGEVRLSRDTVQPNRYVFECADGWLRWHVHDADRVELGLGDVDAGFRAQIHRVARDGSHPALGAPRGGFEESFVAQIRNVVDAAGGRAPLVVSAADGLASLRAIDACRSRRALMSMPWLGGTELARARQLGGVA